VVEIKKMANKLIEFRLKFVEGDLDELEGGYNWSLVVKPQKQLHMVVACLWSEARSPVHIS
jgi:hypothetical protein